MIEILISACDDLVRHLAVKGYREEEIKDLAKRIRKMIEDREENLAKVAAHK